MNNVTPMPLGELVRLQAGVGFPLELQGRTSGTYPLAKVGDISRVGRAGQSTLSTADHYVDDDDLPRLKAKPIPAGSILFAKIGEAIRHNHRVIAGCELLIDNNAMAAIPNDGIDSRYLYHFLRSVDFYALASATTVPALRKSDLERLQVPLLPLREQRRIGDVLDRAEALRAKRRAALALLDTLTQSIFLELFGDAAKNDRNWPTQRMEELMKIRRGGSPRPIENYLGGEINWIKIGDGTQGSDIYLQRCVDKITKEGLKKTVFLRAGSLIFANCGVSLGFARILKIDGCIHDGWLSFEDIPEEKLDKLFLLKALNSITNHFRQIAPSGTQPNLNTALMKNFRIILPPITLQREFARRLVQVEKLKTAQRASLSELDSLFGSLQHHAFKGEL